VKRGERYPKNAREERTTRKMKMGMHTLLEVLQHRLFLHFAIAGGDERAAGVGLRTTKIFGFDSSSNSTSIRG
jgi:hypothetical protein